MSHRSGCWSTGPTQKRASQASGAGWQWHKPLTVPCPSRHLCSSEPWDRKTTGAMSCQQCWRGPRPSAVRGGGRVPRKWEPDSHQDQELPRGRRIQRDTLSRNVLRTQKPQRPGLRDSTGMCHAPALPGSRTQIRKRYWGKVSTLKNTHPAAPGKAVRGRVLEGAGQHPPRGAVSGRADTGEGARGQDSGCGRPPSSISSPTVCTQEAP